MECEPLNSDDKAGPRGPVIVLGRHGQTVFNRDGLIMGRWDSPLTPEGIAVPERLAELLLGEEVTRVFCSSLGRATQTAGIYGRRLGLDLTAVDEIMELSCGVWEGKTRAETMGDRDLLRGHWDDRPPEGESYRDAETRVGRFIEALRNLPAEQIILVIGHASVNRVFLKLWLRIGEEVAIRLQCPHERLHLLGDSDRVTRIDSDWSRGTGLRLFG